MKLLTKRAKFLVGCLDLPAAAEVDGAKWEPFQINHLNDDHPLRIEEKSRQIAWSFTVAAEAVAKAVLDNESTAFVSINLEEAKEKVIYAKRVLEHLQVSGLPRLTSDSILGLQFDNGARLLSLPSRPPRGKAKFNVVLDEFGHVQFDRQIYRAAFPFTTRGGVMRIGSSPMGADGTFWEIARQELRQYPGYHRAMTPWWKIRSFCHGPSTGAEALPTVERVDRYGNASIKNLFNNMLLEDFQQEFECVYVGENTAFFPWELIKRNQEKDLECWHVTDPADVEGVVKEIKDAIAAGRIESVMVGGVDVGRTKDLTEIFILGARGDSNPLRLMVSLDKVPFKVQESVIRYLLKILPICAILIDKNGLGMHLAENLEYDTVAEGATFTNESKHLWAGEVKIRMQDGTIPIPNDKDLAYQIHSVKKLVTAAKNVIYDTSRNEKHHADKFWAWALGVWASRQYRDTSSWDKLLVKRK